MTPARKDPDLSNYSGRFAARLRKLREKTGLTHEQVAKAMKVTITTYYRWESGQNHPKPDYLPKLAKTLGIDNIRTLIPQK